MQPHRRMAGVPPEHHFMLSLTRRCTCICHVEGLPSARSAFVGRFELAYVCIAVLSIAFFNRNGSPYPRLLETSRTRDGAGGDGLSSFLSYGAIHASKLSKLTRRSLRRQRLGLENCEPPIPMIQPSTTTTTATALYVSLTPHAEEPYMARLARKLVLLPRGPQAPLASVFGELHFTAIQLLSRESPSVVRRC